MRGGSNEMSRAQHKVCRDSSGPMPTCEALLRTTGSIATLIFALLSLCIPGLPAVASAADSTGADLGPLRQQINKIKEEKSAERRRVDQDEQLIRQLEQQLEQLQSQHAVLTRQADALK